MQNPQTQKPHKADGSSQIFNDLVQSLRNAFSKLYRDNASLVIVFVFIVLICCYIIFRAINSVKYPNQ